VTGPRLLRLLIAVTLTAYIIWDANPREVARAGGGADLSWIAIAVLLVFFDRGLMAWRWMDLLASLSPGTRPPFPVVLRIFFVSTFVGTFLPSVGGDVYRAYSLSRHDVRISESAASVLMDRVLGVLSIVLLGAAALAAAPGVARDRWVVVSLAAAGAGCLVAGVAVFSGRAAETIQRAALRLPSPRLQRVTSVMTDAVRRYARHHGELLRVLAVSVVVQGVRVLQAFCLGRAIGIDLPMSMYFVFIPIALLVMLLPITVNGFGTGQWAFAALFGQAGVAAGDSVALSLLFIALGIVGNLPGALLYATGERPSR
jgi:uncharacterized protein (TIRG00374 family)